MEVDELFPGVFRVDGRLATVSMAKGVRVYGEVLVDHESTQYRMWNPYRSKLAAAIIKGLRKLDIAPGSSVLYLGASTGTTCSHVSDIVGGKGLVYCVEMAERSMRDLLKVCERRGNMLPIHSDARNVDAYAADVGVADVIYQDLSARDQDAILLSNARLLKKGGYAYVAIKSQSIDVAADPGKVYDRFLSSVSKEFSVEERIDIMPYDKLHLFVVLKKR